jgi:hypothetical protein
LYDEQWDEQGKGLDKEENRNDPKWFFIDKIEEEFNRRSTVYNINGKATGLKF